MALTITTVRQYLDWPLGQTINQEDLKQQLGVHATDNDGVDLTDKVLFNLTQVNIDQQGEYPVVLSVMDATGQTAQTSVTLDVRPLRSKSDDKSSSPKEAARLALGPDRGDRDHLPVVGVV